MDFRVVTLLGEVVYVKVPANRSPNLNEQFAGQLVNIR